MSVTYSAKNLVYKTVAGDMWDMIALREYGDEHAMNFVQDANFDYRFIDVFGGDVLLTIPQAVTVGTNRKIQKVLPDLEKLLPWR